MERDTFEDEVDQYSNNADYLKRPFVIESEEGGKLFVSTFREYVSLEGNYKKVARRFIVLGCSSEQVVEGLTARKVESFELV